MTIRRPVWAIAAVLGAMLSFGACGSDNSSSGRSASPTTTAAAPTTSAGSTAAASGSPSGTTAGTASAAVCSARDDLQTTLKSLTSVDVVKNGTSALQSALTKIKGDLTTIKSAASADLQPQVKAFEDSLQQLETALGGSGASGVAGVVTAAAGVVQTGTTLLTGLQQLKCA